MARMKVGDEWESNGGKVVTIKKVTKTHVHYRYNRSNVKCVRELAHFQKRFEPVR